MTLTKTQNGIEVPLSEEEILEFLQNEQAHKDRMEAYELIKYQDLRRFEYPTIDELLVALIEEREGRPEVLEELMTRRARIKAKHPKPS